MTLHQLIIWVFVAIEAGLLVIVCYGIHMSMKSKAEAAMIHGFGALLYFAIMIIVGIVGIVLSVASSYGNTVLW